METTALSVRPLSRQRAAAPPPHPTQLHPRWTNNICKHLLQHIPIEVCCLNCNVIPKRDFHGVKWWRWSEIHVSSCSCSHVVHKTRCGDTYTDGGSIYISYFRMINSNSHIETQRGRSHARCWSSEEIQRWMCLFCFEDLSRVNESFDFGWLAGLQQTNALFDLFYPEISKRHWTTVRVQWRAQTFWRAGDKRRAL